MLDEVLASSTIKTRERILDINVRGISEGFSKLRLALKNENPQSNKITVYVDILKKCVQLPLINIRISIGCVRNVTINLKY